MNKVILVGRLTANPELRQTQSGVASCRFTVAIDRKFADKNTGEKQSDFITCVAWRQTAEFVSRYFNKGKIIALEGSLRTGKYRDKNHEDVTHYTTEVYVDNVEFVGGKGDGGQQTQATPAQTAPTPMAETTSTETVEILNEDIPF